MTNPDGGQIVQAIGPLKTHAYDAREAEDEDCPRFLIVTELNNRSQVVLRQGDTSRRAVFAGNPYLARTLHGAIRLNNPVSHD